MLGEKSVSVCRLSLGEVEFSGGVFVFVFYDLVIIEFDFRVLKEEYELVGLFYFGFVGWWNNCSNFFYFMFLIEWRW